MGHAAGADIDDDSRQMRLDIFFNPAVDVGDVLSLDFILVVGIDLPKVGLDGPVFLSLGRPWAHVQRPPAEKRLMSINLTKELS
jgi:hypothetical protein